MRAKDDKLYEGLTRCNQESQLTCRQTYFEDKVVINFSRFFSICRMVSLRRGKERDHVQNKQNVQEE